MKKVLLSLLFFVFVVTISSSANIFSRNNVNADNQMFEEFTRTGNPDFDLEFFAKKNNLNKNEAKKILSEKFGNPQKPDDKLFKEVTKSKNPDIDLNNFASAHNVTREESKIILEKMFGEPEIRQ